MRIRIRDLVNLGSGTEKIGSGIRDLGEKHLGPATLGFSRVVDPYSFFGSGSGSRV
jgi:hypothetical protein